MKTVRLFYKKTGAFRFCSHLDMTRFMARIIRRAKLPVWYTEGFNPHLYLTFALPLPLGFTSDYEVTDIRITDDGFDIYSIPETLNAVCPEGIRFYKVSEPKLKTGEVGAASYTAVFSDGGEVFASLDRFLKSGSITVAKKTKRGEEKQIEVADKIKINSLTVNDSGNTELKITLPAGGSLNINPELILSSFFENENYYCYRICRTAVLDTKGNIFE